MTTSTASLLHSPSTTSLSHSCSTSQTPPPRTATCLHRTRTAVGSKRRQLVLRSSADASDVLDSIPPFPSTPFNVGEVASFKLKLLGVVSGLNRGLAATEDDLQKADTAAKKVEEIGGPVDLSVDLDKLQGRWKLVYSSAFSSRTLGGSRPGPPIGRLLPITLGQVFQRIDILSKDFDNIVDLKLGTPWPVPPVELTATLAHTFEVIGSSTIKIKFEKTSVKATGNLSQLPVLEVPQLPESLRPRTNKGSGEFEITYLDSDTRITRGDRGELRVFVIA